MPSILSAIHNIKIIDIEKDEKCKKYELSQDSKITLIKII